MCAECPLVLIGPFRSKTEETLTPTEMRIWREFLVLCQDNEKPDNPFKDDESMQIFVGLLNGDPHLTHEKEVKVADTEAGKMKKGTKDVPCAMTKVFIHQHTREKEWVPIDQVYKFSKEATKKSEKRFTNEFGFLWKEYHKEVYEVHNTFGSACSCFPCCSPSEIHVEPQLWESGRDEKRSDPPNKQRINWGFHFVTDPADPEMYEALFNKKPMRMSHFMRVFNNAVSVSARLGRSR